MRVFLVLVSFVFAGCGNGASAPPATPTPAAIEAALAAVHEYLDSGQLDKAHRIAARLVETSSDDARAHETLALVLIARGSEAALGGDADVGRALFAEAYNAYLAALEIAPSAGLHQSAGEIAQASGRVPEALEHYREAGRLDVDVAKHPLYEGLACIALAQYDDAKAALERVIEIDPDEAVAHVSLATVALEQDRVEDALDHVAEARDIAPDEAAYRMQEAIARRRLGEPRTALELLLSLPDDVRLQEAYTREIASCWSALGEPVRAAEAWERRFDERPGDTRGWHALTMAGFAWHEAGNDERARSALDRAAALVGDVDEVVALRNELAR